LNTLETSDLNRRRVTYDAAEIFKKAFRRTPSDSPEAAARYVRTSTSAILRGPASDGVASKAPARPAQRDALIAWAERNKKRLDKGYVSRFPFFGSGAEHRVYHDQDHGLAIKITHPGSFGYSAHSEGAKATPIEYLERLSYANALFGDEIRIVGVCGAKNMLQVIISQPWIPANRAEPTATEKEIEAYFERLRFRRVEINPGVPIFYNSDVALIVADAHVGNVLRSEQGLVPIDVVIGTPGPALLKRILEILESRPS
jgi:hypothetical protein